MENYNYLESIMADVENAIEDDKDYWNGYNEMDRDEKESFLNEKLWEYDSVTGNASGSYFFNSYRAKQAVLADDNIDLLIDACDEFGSDLGDTIKEGWEACDVTIRCYLLGQGISGVLDYQEGEEE